MDPILQLILNQPDGKQLLQNYRQILWHTTFGTNTFRISKNQACKIMNAFTLMETKNYMLHAKCAQLTWKCTN